MAYRGEAEIAVCPRCVEAALEPLARGHVRIFACKTCSGVFLELCRVYGAWFDRRAGIGRARERFLCLVGGE